MVIGPAGPGNKNDRAGEDHQKFSWNRKLRCCFLNYTASKLQDVSLLMICEALRGSGHGLIQVNPGIWLERARKITNNKIILTVVSWASWNRSNNRAVKFTNLGLYSVSNIVCWIQNVPGVKVNTLGGHSIGHSKQKRCICSCVHIRLVCLLLTYSRFVWRCCR
jgi:hypothetical protein